MSRFEAPECCPFCGGVLPLLALCGEEGRRYVLCHGCEARGPVEHSDMHAVAGFEGDAGFTHISKSADHLVRVFEDWNRLPLEGRPDFLTYAHARRSRPEKATKAND